jgi:uncharacterized protein
VAPHIGHPRAPRSQRGPQDQVITAMQITEVKPALGDERPGRAYGDRQEETGVTTVTAKPANVAALELTDWRCRVGELYAAVRALDEPERAHALWRSGRDALFWTHPQSPLPPDDQLRETGIPYWDYDPAMRFERPLLPALRAQQRPVPTDGDGITTLRLIGHVKLPAPVNVTVDVWWLQQYGGGLFLPLRDGTAGDTSYSGGRYALDTAKGADLGGAAGTLIIDLNFLYHPSCRYSSEWVCPLAPPGNTIAAPVRAGERLSHSHRHPGA